MKQFIAPSESERKHFELMQKEFVEKCRKEDINDPPKNVLHKAGRAIWRMLTFPRDPRTF